MKKYIAPEMEIAKFTMEDIITTSGDPVVTNTITPAEDLQYKGFSETAEYGAF